VGKGARGRLTQVPALAGLVRNLLKCNTSQSSSRFCGVDSYIEGEAVQCPSRITRHVPNLPIAHNIPYPAPSPVTGNRSLFPLLPPILPLCVNQIKSACNVHRIIQPKGPLKITGFHISNRYIDKRQEHAARPHEQERPIETGYVVGAPGLPDLWDDSDAEDDVPHPADDFKCCHNWGFRVSGFQGFRVSGGGCRFSSVIY
jgi:hypothetical protein